MPPSPITPPYSQDQHSRAEPLFHCLQEKSHGAQRSEGVAQRPQNSVESPSTHPRIPRQGPPPCTMRHGPGIQCRHPNDPDQSASPLHDRCTQSRAWGWSGIQSSTGDQNGRHNEGLGSLRRGGGAVEPVWKVGCRLDGSPFFIDLENIQHLESQGPFTSLPCCPYLT